MSESQLNYVTGKGNNYLNYIALQASNVEKETIKYLSFSVLKYQDPRVLSLTESLANSGRKL